MAPKRTRSASQDRFANAYADYGRSGYGTNQRPHVPKASQTSLGEQLRAYQAPEPVYEPAPPRYDIPEFTPAPRPHKAKKRKGKLVATLAILALLAGGGFGGFKYFTRTSASDKAVASTSGQTLGVSTADDIGATPNTSQTSQPKAVELTTDADMAAAINAAIAANPTFNIAVSVVPLKTGTALNYGIDAVFDATSTGYLVPAAAYLRQVENGGETMEKVIAGKSGSDLLQSMIKDGNVDAWNTVMNELTKANVQSFAQSIGMGTYTASNNRMKPQDLSALLLQIYQGKITGPNKDKLYGFMQQSDKPEYVVQALPTDGTVKVYHRAGSLPDRSEDAAIIDNGTNPYALVVYVKGSNAGAEAQRIDIIHAIVKATVQRYINKSL